MVIGGLQKFSLSDYPGLISAIVFTRGCGFRCPYCHNPELVDPLRFAPEIPVDVVRTFLRSRQGQIQGVVVSGGEPTIHADLPAFLEEIREMGFAVKLDTNGSNPQMLRLLIVSRFVDFIAMDVKAPLPRYPEIVRAAVPRENLRESIELILASGLRHEFRTTFVESLLATGDMQEIARLVKGCRKYVIQAFRTGKLLDADIAEKESSHRVSLEELARALAAEGCVVEVR
jgi:pyruvate formate lyase activating enzyme